MNIISWPLIGVCLLLVFTIGGGGFYLGFTRGVDRGERDQADWCERHHQGAADELDELDECPLADLGTCPLAADQAYPTGRHAATEAWPAVASGLAVQQAIGLAWAFGQITDSPQRDELDRGDPSPAAVELDVNQMIERSKLDMQHLLDRNAKYMGEITDGK